MSNYYKKKIERLTQSCAYVVLTLSDDYKHRKFWSRFCLAILAAGNHNRLYLEPSDYDMNYESSSVIKDYDQALFVWKFTPEYICKDFYDFMENYFPLHWLDIGGKLNYAEFGRILDKEHANEKKKKKNPQSSLRIS